MTSTLSFCTNTQSNLNRRGQKRTYSETEMVLVCADRVPLGMSEQKIRSQFLAVHSCTILMRVVMYTLAVVQNIGKDMLWHWSYVCRDTTGTFCTFTHKGFQTPRQHKFGRHFSLWCPEVVRLLLWSERNWTETLTRLTAGCFSSSQWNVKNELEITDPIISELALLLYVFHLHHVT